MVREGREREGGKKIGEGERVKREKEGEGVREI